MRRKFLILVALLVVSSVSFASAQDSMLVNEVSFAGYRFSVTSGKRFTK